MVTGLSLLLRVLPLLLWGCQDAQPTPRGHPELRQEAEVRGVPGREEDITRARSPPGDQLCPFALTVYKERDGTGLLPKPELLGPHRPAIPH